MTAHMSELRAMFTGMQAMMTNGRTAQTANIGELRPSTTTAGTAPIQLVILDTAGH